MLKRLCAAVSALLLAGCTTPGGQANDDSAVGIGDVARVGDLRIRPDKVAEDSRCPVNADCFWSGRIVLAVTIYHGTVESRAKISSIEPSRFADGILKLVSVTPEPHTEKIIRESDYQFAFRFLRDQ